MLNFLLKYWQIMASWQVNKKTSGQVNKLIVLFSFLEKCVFSPWQCSSKLDRVQLAYWKRSFLVCWHKHVHFWHKNIRNIKKRSLLFPHYVPLTVRFQLVANALNGLRQVAFSNTTAFCHRQMWQDYIFYCIFVQYFVHERSVCLGFTAKDNKLLSICRDFKSLDDFIIRQQTRYSASMPNMVTLVE